jgi:hypothetical protein
VKLLRFILFFALALGTAAGIGRALAVTTDVAELRFVAKGVDLVGGSTAVVIPATPRKWLTRRIDVHVRTVTGFVAVASVSLGANSASFNNVMAIGPLTGASGVDSTVAQSLLVVLTGAVDLTASGLQVKVTTPAVATTMTVDVHVTGHFLEP